MYCLHVLRVKTHKGNQTWTYEKICNNILKDLNKYAGEVI